ncbi:hypothetical protein P355_1811 [Burkholderia cenocepacia KC-01]|nr:hypothetical protein P355_1811 [Burkholderia cenocepacia KC-01]
MGVQRVSCDRQMDLVNVILDKDAASEHLGSSGLNKTQAPSSLQRTIFALHGRERRQQFTFELRARRFRHPVGIVGVQHVQPQLLGCRCPVDFDVFKSHINKIGLE